MYGQQDQQPGPDSPQQYQRVLESAARRQLESRQSVLLGIVGGLLGAAIGAVLWAVVTVVTEFQIGFMAIGVGFLAGKGAWIGGRGLKPTYGLIGGVMAMLGCAAGNLLSACAFIAQLPEAELTFFQILGNLDFELINIIMRETFHPLDVLFGLIAISTGWKYSYRELVKG